MIKLNYLIFVALLIFTACSSSDDNIEPSNNGAGDAGTEDVTLTSVTEVTDADGNIYKVGFDQASSNNQNPYVEKTDAGGGQAWRINHENTGVDGRAVLVTVDSNNNPWVIFTVDGGSNDNGYINKKEVEDGAFSGVFQNGYGSGGGAKVAIIARLNPSTGKIVKGSFVTARLNSGNTNTFSITEVGFANGNFAFKGVANAWATGAGTSYVKFPGITEADRVDGKTTLYYEMKTDLSEIVVAEIRN